MSPSAPPVALVRSVTDRRPPGGTTTEYGFPYQVLLEPGSDISCGHVYTRTSADENLISPAHTAVNALKKPLADKETR
jgi:hypothetical protein